MCSNKNTPLNFRSVVSINNFVIFFIVLFSVLILIVDCFNVETEHFTRHRGTPNSMFGFSVALHRYQGASWIIVGAPEAETQQPGVVRPGAVYRCSVVSPDSCQELPFDRTGNNNNSRGQVDLKSHQWFGATVDSVGIDGPVVACAPRYVWFSTSLTRRDPVGTCYVAKGDFSSYSEYSPCRTRQWGYHRQGSCQAGLGAAISKDGSRLYIGAPGSWYWQGQLYSVKATLDLPFVPPRYKQYGEGGQVHAQNVNLRANVYQTSEGPAIDDDSYLGYSVAVGLFHRVDQPQNKKGSDKRHLQDDVAVGMPRGAGLLGKVLLYTSELINLQNITGQQLGAYFGYSLAVADIDGDYFDDLIVGAPMYTELNNNEGKYETGRVYVYYQNSDQGLFQKFHTLDGVNSKARFGLSVSTAGDINLDDFDDLIVGAPYDGEFEQGAIYIYHGSEKGIREKPSQIIFAERLAEPALRTFGFSVAGGIDLDNNEYPDLVVGAYESNKAFLFRARPVVKMDASVSFNVMNRQINLDDKNCTLKRFNEKVPCTSINLCLEYKGSGVRNVIPFNVQYVLDSKKLKTPRMFFLQEENNIRNETIVLEHSKRQCKTIYVFVKNGIRDKLTALEVEMRYSIIYDRRNQYFQLDRELLPVLDDTDGLVARDSISIQKNCGSDNVCIPDLRLIAAPSVNKFLLGSNEKLKIEVEVQNEAEDAFEATFNMKVPDGANFTKIERLDSLRAEIPITCSAPSPANNQTLKCDIGNPLPRDKIVRFNVVLALETKPSYDFYINVNSTNPERNESLSDNSKHISVGILVETDFTIDGTSRNQEILFNSSQYTETNITEESQLGPQVTHIYSIRNNGPSDIEEMEVYFIWPMKTLDGDTLFYMVDEPETAGPIQCESSEFINEYNLKVESRKSYLEANRIATGTFSSSFSKQTGERRISESDNGRRVTGVGTGSQTTRVLTAEERRRMDEDEFREETGDASYRHIERTREQSEQRHRITSGGSRESGFSSSAETSYGHGGRHVTGSGNVITESDGRVSGGRRVIEHRYESRWNSSQVTGGPVRNYTWSHNTSRVIGPNGIARERQQTNFGVGSPNVRQSIYYTSSGGGSRSGITSSSSLSENTAESGSVSGKEWHDRQSKARTWSTGSTSTQEESSGIAQFSTERSASGSHKINYQESQWNREHPRAKPELHRSTLESTYGAREWRGSNVRVEEESSVRTGSDGYHITEEDSAKRNTSKTYFIWAPNGTVSRAGDYHGKIWTEEKINANLGPAISSGTYSSEGETSSEIGIRQESTNQEHRGRETQLSYDRRGYENHQGETSREIGSRQESTRQDHRGKETQLSHDRREYENRQAIASRNQSHSGRDRSTYGQYDQRQYDPNLGLGNAALGSGFRTSVLDLGVLGSDSTSQQGVRTQAAGRREYDQGEESIRYGTSYSSGEREDHPEGYDPDLGYVRKNKHSYEESRGSGNVHGNQGSEEYYRSSSSRSYSSHSSSSGQEGSQVYTNSEMTNVDPRTQTSHNSRQYSYSREYNYPPRPNDHDRRSKRQVEDSNGDYYLDRALNCKATKCAVMKCTVGPLVYESSKRETWIVFKGRANATTIRQLGGNNPVTISTMMVARISKLPYIGRPDDLPIKSHEVFTTIVSKDVDSKPDVVPLWVVVLSAVAGTLILLLLIYLLYVMGFFKRNRPNDAPERQPLNRNGHYQNGDEQL